VKDSTTEGAETTDSAVIARLLQRPSISPVADARFAELMKMHKETLAGYLASMGHMFAPVENIRRLDKSVRRRIKFAGHVRRALKMQARLEKQMGLRP